MLIQPIDYFLLNIGAYIDLMTEVESHTPLDLASPLWNTGLGSLRLTDERV